MKLNTDYFRSLIFGAEDSFVSTVGVLFGVASTGSTSQGVIVTGLIVVAVEALSMGAGAFLTETSAHEVDQNQSHDDSPVIAGVIMFFSYALTGFIPLFPYFLFDVSIAKYVSLCITLVGLFILGFLPTKKIRAGVRMALIAGGAVMIGFVVGRLVKIN